MISKSPTEFQLEQGTINDDTRALAIEQVGQCHGGIKEVLKRYVDTSDDNLTVIATWIVGTYVHKEFSSFPFLFINAMKGSGKTRLLKLIESLCWNGKITNNLTESVLFRTAERNTILLDEFEAPGSREKSVMRELLNSAYKKGTIVERMRKSFDKDGEVHIVEKFKMYTPIAIANIWGMEEVLGDRCLSVVLERSNDPHKTKLLEDFDTNPFVKSIKKMLNELKCSLCSVVYARNVLQGWNAYIDSVYNYTTTYNTYIYNTTLSTLHLEEIDDRKEREKIKEQGPDFVLTEENMNIFKKIKASDINGRNLELFFPLFITGDIIGNGLLDELIRIAEVFLKERKGEDLVESKDVSVIDFIANKHESLEYFSVSDLTKQFKDFYQDDDEEVKWLNNKWMGRALKRLKLVRDKRRIARGVEVQLAIARAKEKIKMFKEVDPVDDTT